MTTQISALANTRWTVTAVNGQGTGGAPSYFVSFGPESFEANLGCNSFEAAYTIRGTQLVPGMARSTERACASVDDSGPDPMRFEQTGFQVLSRAMDIELIGDILSLSNRAGSLTLRVRSHRR